MYSNIIFVGKGGKEHKDKLASYFVPVVMRLRQLKLCQPMTMTQPDDTAESVLLHIQPFASGAPEV